MAREKTTPLLVRLAAARLADLDAWRRAQPDIPTRPEAIRRLVDRALSNTGTTETPAIAALSARSSAKPPLAGIAKSAKPKSDDDDPPPKSKAAQIAALRKRR